MDTAAHSRSRIRRVPFALGVFTYLITVNGLDLTVPHAQDVVNRPKCGKVLIVDFAARSVAGIALDRNIEELQRELGKAAIKRVVEYLEGGPHTAHDMNLCGHRVRRHWSGVSWKDRALRTVEGIGVGSPLYAFDRQYGRAEVTLDEGDKVQYVMGETVVNVFVNSACYLVTAEIQDVNRKCQAISLWFMLRS